MRRGHVVETRRDRTALAHDAGLGKLSFTSALAGMLCAFGSFAVLAAIAGAVLRAMGVESTNDISGDWREVGIGTGVVLALVLFLSYLFGGYVAGRMARRGGAMNGLLVFVLGILLAVGVGAAVGTQADGDALLANLRSIGVPTSGDEYSAIGTIAGLAAVAAMLFGSILGGIAGERWHGKLLTRALDPTVGPDHTDDGDRDHDGVRDRTEVRSSGRHFLTDGDSDRAERTEAMPRTDDDADRTLDVGNTSTTLDEDLDPERTRTIRS